MRKRSRGTTTSSRRSSRSAAWLGVGVVALVIAVVTITTRSGGETADVPADAVAPQLAVSQGALPVVELYKDPGCGCCTKWAEHLQDHGFTVRTTETPNLAAFNASHGVPGGVQSCHTALVGGYIVEGHVPASDIQRLLRERPAVAGLAVPGMPIGSPGMEVPGRQPQAYDVLTFEKDGTTSVFVRHGG
ncbi:MAG: DUF411 domain-containing protein [Vicinamibacterales bacterium]